MAAAARTSSCRLMPVPKAAQHGKPAKAIPKAVAIKTVKKAREKETDKIAMLKLETNLMLEKAKAARRNKNVKKAIEKGNIDGARIYAREWGGGA